MHKNIETVAGCLTRLTCEVITADGATPPELTAYVLIEQQSYPARQEPDGVLLFPAVDYGQHLYEVRADGKPVLFGHLLVRPSAFPQDSGVVDYALAIDASQVDGAKITLTLTPGPRGPQGDTGLSAYDIAALNGYQGSEADWAAELSGAQAAASAAKESQQAAEASASQAASTLTAAAKKNENNTFSATNTFNGVIAANGGISYKGFELSEYISAAGYTQQNLAVAALGDTPMELLPASYAEWKAENSAALDAAEKNTLTILLKAAGEADLTMPEGFKKLIVCNIGNFSVVKRAFAGKSLYIYERASTIQAWNIAEIKAPVVTFVYPELVNGRDSFYSINASRINLVFPKLRSIGSYFLNHNIIGVQEVRFYMPKLAGSCSLFPRNALTAASLLSLAKTLPTVASPQTITIGAAGELQNDDNFQTQLAAALDDKNWTFTLNYI